MVTTPDYAARVKDACDAAGLWCAEWPLSAPPDWVIGAYITWLEMEDGERYLVTASCADGRNLDPLCDSTLFVEPGRAAVWAEDYLSHMTRHDLLLRCHHVTVIDPVWNRAGLLWSTLTDATRALPTII